MESYSREVDEKQKKTEERFGNYAKKTEEMMYKFLRITISVGNQIQGMNSSIIKMKEEEDDRYKQFNERITNMEKSLTWMKNTISRCEETKRDHVDQN